MKGAAMLKKFDFLLIAFIVLAAICFKAYSRAAYKGAYVSVYSGGMLYGEYSLSENGAAEVVNTDGGVNVIEISGGFARVSHADCPDKLCVRQGAVSKSGETIVCIPNRLSLQVGGEGLDGITK